MRQFFKITACIFFVCMCVWTLFDGVLGGAGILIAAPPVVLDTQQMVFLRSLKEEYEAIDTWLNEAEDLSAFVEDGQTLVFPEDGDAPAVYKNKTDDIDSIEPQESAYKVPLDVYDSQNYKLRNIYLHALPFDKVQHYTKKSAKSIVKQEIEDAAHTLSPVQEGNKCIVLPTTGETRGGLKMMTLNDIVALARACDNHEYPEEGRNLVLPSDMWWDLVNNNTILKGQLERVPLDGVIKPLVVEYYGFKIHKSVQKLNIGFDLTQSKKAPQGTLITGEVVPAGFMFVSNMVFRAGGAFFMFRQELSKNTKGRAEEFGFQHRFKSASQMSGNRYTALIYQAKA